MSDFKHPMSQGIENCLDGSNYLRSGEYRRIIEELERLKAIESLCGRATAVCQDFLPPNGPSAEASMALMLEIFDGPEQRACFPAAKPGDA
jgi:hypothetical protein